jgi:hypothetical protein
MKLREPSPSPSNKCYSPSFLIKDSSPPSTGSISIGTPSRVVLAGEGAFGEAPEGFAAGRDGIKGAMGGDCAGSLSGFSSPAGKYQVFLFSSHVW